MYSIDKMKKGEISSLFHYTGFMCIFIGLLMLLPIVVALIYGEIKYILPFIYSSLISLVLGVLLFVGF
jgi:trk system potassium uptake protein TrkH